MKRRFLIGFGTLLSLVMLGFAGSASAADESPDAMIRHMSEEVISAARADKAIQAGDARRTMALVDSKIVPNVNFQRMTAAVVGPAWRQASAQQRERLQQEFKILLVRTYAGALAEIKDQTLIVAPQRTAPTDLDVVVRSEIRGHGDPIDVAYRMERTPGQGSGWRIYNLNLLGVWMVETYRNQFAPVVNSKGIDGLIDTLAERNRTNAGKD